MTAAPLLVVLDVADVGLAEFLGPQAAGARSE